MTDCRMSSTACGASRHHPTDTTWIWRTCDVLPSLAASSLRPRWGTAIDAFGFVQADPIRAPARAQDLTLRHRVEGYRAGDLERHYLSLGVEEDVFINYGFVSRPVQRLMHPASRRPGRAVAKSRRARAPRVRAGARRSASARRRRALCHGRVTNYWGGSSNATTHLLDLLHYRGLLRVAGASVEFASTPFSSTLSSLRSRGAPGARRRPVDIVVRSTRRCRPRLSSSLGACAMRRRSGATRSARPWRGAGSGCHRPGSGTSTGTGRQTRPCRPTPRPRPFGCWPRSIPWFGIGTGSSCSGGGGIDSRPTRRSPSAARLLRPAPSLAGPGDRLGESRVRERRAQRRPWIIGSPPRRDRAFKRELDAELARIRLFLGRARGRSAKR